MSGDLNVETGTSASEDVTIGKEVSHGAQHDFRSYRIVTWIQEMGARVVSTFFQVRTDSRWPSRPERWTCRSCRHLGDGQCITCEATPVGDLRSTSEHAPVRSSMISAGTRGQCQRPRHTAIRPIIHEDSRLETEVMLARRKVSSRENQHRHVYGSPYSRARSLSGPASEKASPGT